MIYVYFISYLLNEYFYYLKNLSPKYLIYDVIVYEVNYSTLNDDLILYEDHQLFYFNRNILIKLVLICLFRFMIIVCFSYLLDNTFLLILFL